MANRVVDQVVEGENDGRSIGPDGRHFGRHIYFEPNVAVGQLPRNPCVASEMSAAGSRASNEYTSVTSVTRE